MKMNKESIKKLMPKKAPSDTKLLQIFVGSAVLGFGGIVAPFLLPIAITGMAGSQAVFWAKEVGKHVED
jgi:hypothetical protein